MTPPSNVLLPKAYWEVVNRAPEDNRYAPNEILFLQNNEVFVFGSNADGFHGAGAAGYAYTGESGNQYRAGNPLLRSPKGTMGAWAVLGKARGFQEGKTGRSYAICTIIHPGQKRSMPLSEIKRQIIELYKFACAHPNFTFFVVQSGRKGAPSLSGYSLEENARCYLG